MGPCKHAVAVILAAVEYVKRKEMIPLLHENSDLHEALHGDTEEDEEWLDDEWEDDDSVYNSAPRHTKAQAKVRKILEDKNREELLNLLIDLSDQLPDVKQHIVEYEQLASGQTDKLVRALRSEIRDLTAEPAWYNHWRGEGRIPDFSHVEEQLRHLPIGVMPMRYCSWVRNSGPGEIPRSNSPMTREKPQWRSPPAWKSCWRLCRNPLCRHPSNCSG